MTDHRIILIRRLVAPNGEAFAEQVMAALGENEPIPTEDELRELIRDPRYWRDRDPEIVQRVTAGYRRLYPS